jgi:hypothetical protein
MPSVRDILRFEILLLRSRNSDAFYPEVVV